MTLMLLILLLFTLSAHAEVYQWRDEQGQVHFSDRMPTSSGAFSELKNVTPDEADLSTYRAVIPDIKDESDARQARNNARLDEKKRQRLASEKEARADARRTKKCRAARDDYRFGEGRYRATPGLNDLRKARRRIDAIKERIRRYCHSG